MESCNGFRHRSQLTLIDCVLIVSSCGLAFCEYALIETGYVIIKFFITVPTTRRLGPDNVYQVFTHPLECAPLKKSPKFDLSKEDPQLYANEDLSGFNPDREWEDVPLPVAKKASKPVVIPDEVIEKARSQHDILVKWMKSIGLDLCQEMEDTECQYILEAVQANQKECDICHKMCFNTQRLRAHIRAKHMSTTPFQCKKSVRNISVTTMS